MWSCNEETAEQEWCDQFEERFSAARETPLPDLSSMWVEEGDCAGDLASDPAPGGDWLSRAFNRGGDARGWEPTPALLPSAEREASDEETEDLRSGERNGRDLPWQLPELPESLFCNEVLPEGGELPSFGDASEATGQKRKRGPLDEGEKGCKGGRCPGCDECARKRRRSDRERPVLVRANARANLHHHFADDLTSLRKSSARLRAELGLEQRASADLVGAHQRWQDHARLQPPTQLSPYAPPRYSRNLLLDQVQWGSARRHGLQAPPPGSSDSAGGHLLHDPNPRAVQGSGAPEGHPENRDHE